MGTPKHPQSRTELSKELQLPSPGPSIHHGLQPALPASPHLLRTAIPKAAHNHLPRLSAVTSPSASTSLWRWCWLSRGTSSSATPASSRSPSTYPPSSLGDPSSADRGRLTLTREGGIHAGSW